MCLQEKRKTLEGTKKQKCKMGFFIYIMWRNGSKNINFH